MAKMKRKIDSGASTTSQDQNMNNRSSTSADRNEQHRSSTRSNRLGPAADDAEALQDVADDQGDEDIPKIISSRTPKRKRKKERSPSRKDKADGGTSLKKEPAHEDSETEHGLTDAGSADGEGASDEKEAGKQQPEDEDVMPKEASLPMAEEADSEHKEVAESEPSRKADEQSSKAPSDEADTRPKAGIVLPLRPKNPIKEAITESKRVTPTTERSWKEDRSNFRTGKFSKMENELIKAAMLSYVTEHGLGSEGLQKICNVGKHRNLRGAWLEIANCLPDRSVKSIHAHGIQLFKDQLDIKEGKWSEAEVQKLLDLVKVHGRSWVVIGQHLGRTATSVRDKFKDCSNMGEYRKGRWSEEEEQLLRKYVEKYRAPDGVISWASVSAAVKSRNITDCRCKWRLMMQTEKNYQIAKSSGWDKPKLKPDGSRPRTTNPPRDVTIMKDLKLLEELYNSGAEDMSEVVWSRLSHPQARTRWNQLRRNAPDMKFAAAVEKLYSDLKRRMSSLPANKRRLFPTSPQREEDDAPSRPQATSDDEAGSDVGQKRKEHEEEESNSSRSKKKPKRVATLV